MQNSKPLTLTNLNFDSASIQDLEKKIALTKTVLNQFANSPTMQNLQKNIVRTTVTINNFANSPAMQDLKKNIVLTTITMNNLVNSPAMQNLKKNIALTINYMETIKKINSLNGLQSFRTQLNEFSTLSKQDQLAILNFPNTYSESVDFPIEDNSIIKKDLSPLSSFIIKHIPYAVLLNLNNKKAIMFLTCISMISLYNSDYSQLSLSFTQISQSSEFNEFLNNGFNIFKDVGSTISSISGIHKVYSMGKNFKGNMKKVEITNHRINKLI